MQTLYHVKITIIPVRHGTFAVDRTMTFSTDLDRQAFVALLKATFPELTNPQAAIIPDEQVYNRGATIGVVGTHETECFDDAPEAFLSVATQLESYING